VIRGRPRGAALLAAFGARSLWRSLRPSPPSGPTRRDAIARSHASPLDPSRRGRFAWTKPWQSIWRYRPAGHWLLPACRRAPGRPSGPPSIWTACSSLTRDRRRLRRGAVPIPPGPRSGLAISTRVVTFVPGPRIPALGVMLDSWRPRPLATRHAQLDGRHNVRGARRRGGSSA
jgi:hypothetical protein